MAHLKEHRRLYSTILADHLQRHRQMALVSGPRQVGKTTACRAISDTYLNWDNADDRRRMLLNLFAGSDAGGERAAILL
jgi:predicted AAA+ superfamily ATPase